ncbi:WYL domain-containing transcriptional regulator [Vibrio parahaemolyticus]|nr:WYL domain-containing transcriptional regulator [Vibrio parahaemolyticus]MDF5500507.1 WYL domain-containing transcriptional regulator [Vibrio parahaemolyticus]MDF5511241.1 WYL domain-containing transcriptional regulator [Vibrio parahaemolyticus]MDF5558886.1 WYL domain-containing transcriptional regulator [Vibrio parahaemolyticus]
MSDKSEKLAFRLSDILTRLFMGEVLSIEQLMRDYQVSEKTLRRDFNERLIKAPITKCEDGYRLAPVSRIATPNIQKAMNDSGLSLLVPKGLSFNSAYQNLLFKNPRTEHTEKFEATFRTLSDAITSKSMINLTYQGQIIESVHPYRLVNDRGLWYLAATHSGILYSYRLSKISQIYRREDKYHPSPKVRESITSQGMEWLTAEKADVLLQVDADIAECFINDTLLPNQQILKELDDGSLLISSRVTKLADVIPTLKAWMPKIEVLSPVSLKLELIRELNASLERL